MEWQGINVNGSGCVQGTILRSGAETGIDGAQALPGSAVKGVNEDDLGAAVVVIGVSPLGPSPRLAHLDLIARAVADAPKPGAIHKGLREVDGMSVACLPILAEAAEICRKHPGGQVVGGTGVGARPRTGRC